MSDNTDNVDTVQETTPDAERQRVFGMVSYAEESAPATAAVLIMLISVVLTVLAWLFVGTLSGAVATVACVILVLAIWGVQPVVPRILVALVAFAAPWGVAIPQIMANSQLAAQIMADRQAVARPYNDAVAAAKADLEKQGFWVDKLSLNRDNMTQGDASLLYNTQAGSRYASVILIKKDGRWTVNCSTAVGPVDINANGYELGRMLYDTGECPAGFVPSQAPSTP